MPAVREEVGSDTGGKGGSSGNLLCKAEKFPREGVETSSRWGGGMDVGVVHFGDEFAASREACCDTKSTGKVERSCGRIRHRARVQEAEQDMEISSGHQLSCCLFPSRPWAISCIGAQYGTYRRCGKLFFSTRRGAYTRFV